MTCDELFENRRRRIRFSNSACEIVYEKSDRNLSADGLEDALKQGRGRGRAAGYARVHGDDLVDAPEGGVAFAENAAVAPAASRRNDKLRQRRGIMGPPERDLHVPRDRPGDEHVREPRRGGEVDAERARHSPLFSESM